MVSDNFVPDCIFSGYYTWILLLRKLICVDHFLTFFFHFTTCLLISYPLTFFTIPVYFFSTQITPVKIDILNFNEEFQLVTFIYSFYFAPYKSLFRFNFSLH